VSDHRRCRPRASAPSAGPPRQATVRLVPVEFLTDEQVPRRFAGRGFEAAPTTVGRASPVRARACLDLHQGRHADGRRTPNTSAQDALHGGVRDCDPTGSFLALAASRQVQLGTGGNALDVKVTWLPAITATTSTNVGQGAFGTAWNGLVNCTFRLARNVPHKTVSTAYAAQARAPNPVHVVRGGVRESNSTEGLYSERHSPLRSSSHSPVPSAWNYHSRDHRSGSRIQLISMEASLDRRDRADYGHDWLG
jgi:hypothetical protein